MAVGSNHAMDGKKRECVVAAVQGVADEDFVKLRVGDAKFRRRESFYFPSPSLLVSHRQQEFQICQQHPVRPYWVAGQRRHTCGRETGEGERVPISFFFFSWGCSTISCMQRDISCQILAAAN